MYSLENLITNKYKISKLDIDNKIYHFIDINNIDEDDILNSYEYIDY